MKKEQQCLASLFSESSQSRSLRFWLPKTHPIIAVTILLADHISAFPTQAQEIENKPLCYPGNSLNPEKISSDKPQRTSLFDFFPLEHYIRRPMLIDIILLMLTTIETLRSIMIFTYFVYKGL